MSVSQSICLSVHLSFGDGAFVHTWGDKHFYTGDKGNNGVDGQHEEYASEANIIASEASKLSAGARISRGP